MPWLDDLTTQTDDLLSTDWQTRDGNVVPESETVALKDGAVRIEAAFLYADLVGSSLLAKNCPWETTAKIIRAYLGCSTRLIKAWRGEVRSFDGDRVMGIFKGESKESDAVQCAREIFWVVEKLINPKANSKFKSVRDAGINIRNCIGVDTGSAVAVRAGIRGSEDLIWIGRPPNWAAKLSDLREYPYSVLISSLVYSRLSDSQKIVGGENIWQKCTREHVGENLNEPPRVYRRPVSSC